MKKDAPLWMLPRYMFSYGLRSKCADLAEQQHLTNKNHKKYVDLCLNQVYDWAWKSRITWMQA